MDHFTTDPLPRRKGIYIVGGSLRDCMLGRIPTDVDIAVQGDPESLANELAEKLNSRVIFMGRADHPMFRVVTPNRIFDIAPLQGTTIEEDLKCRDFTINALARETVSGKIIDIAQGLQDLRGRQIRQVSKTCFQADPLRLLRAFRIAAQLGFKIERHTLETIRNDRHLIAKPAAERVRSELFGLLGAFETHEWLREMADTGILFNILPEMTAMKDCPQNNHHAFDVFEHTLRTVHHIEGLIREDRRRALHHRALTAPTDTDRQRRLKLAALLHDVGKPLSMQRAIDGHVSFKGHAFAGARVVADLGDRLRFSRNETEHTARMVRYHLRPLLLFNAGRKKTLKQRGVIRFFMKTHAVTADILLLSLADMRAKCASANAADAEFELFIRQLIHQYDAAFKPAVETSPLISGHDLIHHLYLKPSPMFKRILTSIRERQIAGQITTRTEALKFAADTIANGHALGA
ncbi:MAG: CCA tRNA nucleotidyltransferase [Deltaproteobacteria bacterium]|jgi:putative nucleotidyltransferase with HDIG domain|nr:CCA tRNA nucleotidyltransferase [Deltaproteobacteria bacterium]